MFLELDNNILLVDPQRDALYTYDSNEQKAINSEKPWKKDPNHFKKVRISAVALIKMVMHARSGGSRALIDPGRIWSRETDPRGVRKV